MKRLHCLLLTVAALAMVPVNSIVRAQTPVGFIEKFALATDREAAMKELIPGTEEYYFFHALHLQNSRRTADLDALLSQWAKRSASSPLLREIRNRESLLTYDTAPKATLDYLKRTLDLTFDHQQDTLHPKPNLPTALDEKAVAPSVFLEQALHDPLSLPASQITEAGIDYLYTTDAKLSEQQRRLLLERTQRPDEPSLVQRILADLARKNSGGFGELTIENSLLRSQYQELAKAKPDLLKNAGFVKAWLARLRPGADADLEHDAKAREAWLDTLWKFVKDLPPSFNSLKAHILYQRLKHDEKLGKQDRQRFLEYLKLPQFTNYESAAYRDQSSEFFRQRVNPGEEFSDITGEAAIGDGEPLVRRYLLHFLGSDPAKDPADTDFAHYVDAHYLKRVFAEAKLLAGSGDAEAWFSLLTPAQVQELRERVDIEFDPSNEETFLPFSPVSLTLHIKNVPHLAMNIFEINTENFYSSHQQQIGTDLDLDGLVANKHLGFDYSEAPIRQVSRTFKLTDLPPRRGVWVVDFIGNGRSSRALLRKGYLHYVTRASSAGTALTVLDENHNPVPKGYALLGGQKFTANKNNEIIIPFSSAAGQQSLILGDGEGFSQMENVPLEGENYALAAGFHVPRESLLGGGKATAAMRATLTMNGAPVSPGLLEDVSLTILCTTADQVSSSIVKPHLKLERDRETTVEFSVPERLTAVSFTVEGQVRNLISGEKQRLSTQSHVELNQKDDGADTSDLFLGSMGPDFVVQELGRAGEPRGDRALGIRFWRTGFVQPVALEFKTDARGAVHLGALDGITSIEAHNASGAKRTWVLPIDRSTCPSNLHIAAGQQILLPWLDGDAKPVPPLVSLLEERQKLFVRSLADDQHVQVRGAYLAINDLEPGDYNLRYGSERHQVTIRVTQGKQIAGWIVGAARELQARPSLPLQIAAVSVGKDAVTVLLDHVTPDTRVHVLASRFLPPFDVFHDLGHAPGTEPFVSTMDTFHSLFVSGRKLGEEYRYVLERHNAPKYPGVMLPRPGLLLNPWVLRVTDTSLNEARLGDQFSRKKDGTAGGRFEPLRNEPALRLEETQERLRAATQEGVADVDFLATSGFTAWNLVPDPNGKVTLKTADLGDRQFIRILAVNKNDSVVRDVSLPDAKTKLRDLTLRNGLDPNGHFTEQNQISILEKNAPFAIKDATTADFAVQGHLGEVFDLLRTLSENPTLPEFSFILEWPKFDDAKKQSLYSRYACHELSFFLQRRDPAFFKRVILPYLANKRDKTFMDHYLLGDDLHSYLRPWSYQRLNIVERILLAQRHPEEAASTARETRELDALQPHSVERDILLFNSALQAGASSESDSADLGKARGILDSVKRKHAALPSGAFASSFDTSSGVTTASAAAGAAPPPDPFAARSASPRATPVELNGGSLAVTAANTFSGTISETQGTLTLNNGGSVRTVAGVFTEPNVVTKSGRFAFSQKLNSVNAGGEFAPPAVFWNDRNADTGGANRSLLRKMQRLIIPVVQFNGASIEQAIEFLRVKGRELDTAEPDPAKKGVNIYLKSGATPSTAQISLDLHNVPFLEAVRYVSELAGMTYAVKPYGVVVTPVGEVANGQYFRTFKVPPNFLTGSMTPMQVLMSAGIPFPEGASAEFDAADARLVVKNTRPNLDAVTSLVRSRGGEPVGEDMEDEGMDRDAMARASGEQLYRRLDPTSEWAENNYYKLPIAQQLASLVTINGFWKDYAAWDGKGGFLSTHLAEASGSFTEMMFALAVLDLPFPSQAKEPKADVKDLSLTITPAQRLILFHRELKPAEIDKAAPRLLVSQNFYRNGDRYLEHEGEKVDKFVTEEFLTGVVYGCQVVVTNPTASTQKLDLLLQIPQGAMPVLRSKATLNMPLVLEPYHTSTADYFFYFPRAGKFGHHPVHVSKGEKVVAFAPPFTFNVVDELTRLDTGSWDYVSQFGKPQEVLAFLEQHNLHQLDLQRMAWRLRDADFYRKALALLAQHHVYDDTTWSYSILHNDPDAMREYLQHEDRFVTACGSALESRLLTIDPVARYTYQHLEYSPLVNARTHQLGAQRTILNGAFYQQYMAFLDVLAHRPTLSDEDRLAVTYDLFLQDRIEEALATFATVDAAKITEHLQYDYLKATVALYQGDAATARQIAQAHMDHPVDHWKEKFTGLLAQLSEIDGRKPEAAKPENREQVQNKLASSEPTLDFIVEHKEVKLAYHNVREVTVNYYPMDLEFLFSSAPFVSQNSDRFGLIQPNRTEHLQLPADQDTHTFALPREYDSSNLLVEILAAGKTTSHPYYANELNVQVSENYGRLQVLHAKDNRPLPRTYVKVFADINGQAKFYKDGYTDLRGKFDYLSLSTQELSNVTRLSILILSDEFGAAVREVKPPPQ